MHHQKQTKKQTKTRKNTYGCLQPLRPLFFITLLTCVHSPVSYGASQYITGGVTDGLFYKVGGGSVIASNFMTHQPNTVGLGVKWNGNLMCGNFDMKSTVANQLNGVTEGFNNIMGNVISSAKGAVASLPALIIQRANPQLYDLLTNGVMQGKLDFSDLKTDCKQLANKMADYADSSGLVQAAKAENYTQMLSNKVDAIRADSQIEQEAGKWGLTWVGGSKKGGTKQAPIKMTNDVTLAGYNSLLGRSMTDTSGVSGADSKGKMFQTWTSPAKAQEWLSDVIGERTMVTDKENSDGASGKAGRGLNPLTQEYYETYYKNLVDLVNGTTPLDDSALLALNTGALMVTRSTIEALQLDEERGVLVNRLASEMSLARAIEEALMARRLLLAGRKEPNVAQNEKAQKIIDAQIAELDMELNQVKLEYDLKKAITGNTLLLVQERAAQRQRGAIMPSSDSEHFDANK